MKYSNLPVCDLRALKSPEAIRQIESISDIALLVLPRNASDEAITLLASIPRSDIAMELSLPDETEIRVFNGSTEINESAFAGGVDALVVANGRVLVHPLSPDTKGALIANGQVILHDSLRRICTIRLLSNNGSMLYADFEESRSFEGNFEIDADFVTYCRPKTLLLCHKVTFSSSVTVDALKEKDLRIVAHKVFCPKSLAGYLRAVAVLSGTVIEE